MRPRSPPVFQQTQPNSLARPMGRETKYVSLKPFRFFASSIEIIESIEINTSGQGVISVLLTGSTINWVDVFHDFLRFIILLYKLRWVYLVGFNRKVYIVFWGFIKCTSCKQGRLLHTQKEQKLSTCQLDIHPKT